MGYTGVNGRQGKEFMNLLRALKVG
jgi:hypothetical protein